VARGLSEADPSLAALFFDQDDDGDLDLWVGNDMGVAFPDRMYINDGSGNFVDRASDLGYSAAGTDTMGGAIGDVENDGILDLVSTDFTDRPTRWFDCFDRELPCSFESLPPESNLYVNWGVGLVDFDLDGDLDLFQTSGNVFDPELVGDPNQLFVRRDGRWFAHTPGESDALAKKAVHRGAVFGDLDGDGDVDIVTAANGGSPQILRNVSASGHFVRITTEPVLPGTRVRVTAGGTTQTAQIVIGGSYLGTGDPSARLRARHGLRGRGRAAFPGWRHPQRHRPRGRDAGRESLTTRSRSAPSGVSPRVSSRASLSPPSGAARRGRVDRSSEDAALDDHADRVLVDRDDLHGAVVETAATAAPAAPVAVRARLAEAEVDTARPDRVDAGLELVRIEGQRHDLALELAVVAECVRVVAAQPTRGTERVDEDEEAVVRREARSAGGRAAAAR
jgi:hypothetical protein